MLGSVVLEALRNSTSLTSSVDSTGVLAEWSTFPWVGVRYSQGPLSIAISFDWLCCFDILAQVAYVSVLAFG